MSSTLTKKKTLSVNLKNILKFSYHLFLPQKENILKKSINSTEFKSFSCNETSRFFFFLLAFFYDANVN